MSRDLIVSRAVQLLDTEGPDALSMRRLGAELNAPATSINWHVAKDELIELVVNEVLGEVTVPHANDPAGWRAAATGCAHSLRSMILRHPWIATMLGDVLIGLGPNMRRLTEGLLTMFESAGLSLEEADQALNVLTSYVLGTAIGEAAMLTKLARSGRDERDLTNAALPSASTGAEEYPRLRRLHAAYRGKDPQQARDKSFDAGLRMILDGIEVW